MVEKKEKQGVMKRISNVVSMLKELDKDTLQGIRMTLFFFIIIDIFVFYWWMKWKSFAVATLLVCCVILAVVLMLERKFPPYEDKKNNGNKINPVFDNKPKQGPTQEFLEIDLGIPSAEDYNKRLNTALTT